MQLPELSVHELASGLLHEYSLMLALPEQSDRPETDGVICELAAVWSIDVGLSASCIPPEHRGMPVVIAGT